MNISNINYSDTEYIGGAHMDLKLLEHFISVVQYGSFSRAAQQSFVSQPTLSKSIKKLEEQLQVILFERSTRKLRLTDAGELVYEQSLKIIGSTNELFTLIDDFIEKPSGTVNIGIPPLIGTLFFPIIAKNFVPKHPNISLQLVEHGAKKIEYLVDDGQIDLGIVVLPVNEKLFSVTQIVHEPFKCFVHVEHPFASKTKITIHELKNESFILFNSEFALHHLIINYCENFGKFHPKIAFETSQWDVIAELVAAQVGMTLLPESIYKKMDTRTITSIELIDAPMWQLGVITKKDRYTSYALQTLLHFLQKQFSNGVNKRRIEE